MAFVFSGFNTQADSVENQIRELSRSRTWQLLVHYDESFLGVSSSVIDQAFFLSPNGKTDPASELLATYRGVVAGEPAVICNYPARTQWLIQSMGLAISEPFKNCTDLLAWKKDLDAEGLSLVMPTSSVDSSLAVFSHTFLKIRSHKYSPESTLHTAVSYAASFHANSSIFELAFKGVFGGYVGHFGTPGYYGEIAHYGYADSREIFEYRLNLTAVETDQVLNHLWELRTYGIRYYFLTGNCSYYVLTLLDIARPSLNLSAQFHGIVLPAETIQEVFWNTNLVSAIDFVPSKETKRVRTLASLTPSELEEYHRLTLEPVRFSEVWGSSVALPINSRARVLDAFGLFLGRSSRPEQAELRAQVAQARAALGVKVPPVEMSPLSTPPHLGHHSHVVSLGGGSEDGNGFAWFRYRLVEHDFLNNPLGHDPNSDVEAFDFQGMLKGSQVALYKVGLFSFTALRPVDREQQKLSTLFRSQFERRIINNDFHAPMMNSYGEGLSVDCGPLLSYLFVTADSMLDPALQSGYQLGAGALLGARWLLSPRMAIAGRLWETRYFLGESEYKLDADLGVSYWPDRNWEIRASAAARDVLSEYLLGLSWFF